MAPMRPPHSAVGAPRGGGTPEMSPCAPTHEPTGSPQCCTGMLWGWSCRAARGGEAPAARGGRVPGSPAGTWQAAPRARSWPRLNPRTRSRDTPVTRNATGSGDSAGGVSAPAQPGPDLAPCLGCPSRRLSPPCSPAVAATFPRPRLGSANIAQRTEPQRRSAALREQPGPAEAAEQHGAGGRGGSGVWDPTRHRSHPAGAAARGWG